MPEVVRFPSAGLDCVADLLAPPKAGSHPLDQILEAYGAVPGAQAAAPVPP